MRSLRLVFALAALAALGAVAAPMASAGPADRADRALKREASRLLTMPNGPPGVAITVQRGKRRTFLNGGRAIAGTRRRIRSTDHMPWPAHRRPSAGPVALLLVERTGILRRARARLTEQEHLDADLASRVGVSEVAQHRSPHQLADEFEIGRASCRERV